jgi:hypothetical protein
MTITFAALAIARQKGPMPSPSEPLGGAMVGRV